MAQTKKKTTGKTKTQNTKKKPVPGAKTSRSASQRGKGSRPASAAAKKEIPVQEKAGKKTPADNGLWDEVLLMLVFAAALLLFLGNINLAGNLGRILREIQLGAFGTLGYLLPLYLVWAGCFCYMNLAPHPGNTLLKLLTSFITLTSACGLAELLGGRQLAELLTLSRCYEYGAEGLNGGLFGGFYYLHLYPVFGVLGTYVVLIVLLVIGFVLTTGKSLILPVKEKGKMMMESAKEQSEIRREESQIRREERKLRRDEERMVREERMMVQQERRKNLESRRTELRVRSLKFGEETRIDPADLEATDLKSPDRETAVSADTPPVRKITAEDIEAMEWNSAERKKSFRPRREKRTLSELSALDRPADGEEMISLEEEMRPEPAPVPEPVIHLHGTPAEPESPVVPEAPAESEKAEMPRPETSFEEQEAEPASAARGSRTFPAEEPEDDGMSAYDRFEDDIPSEWELDMLQDKPSAAAKKTAAGGKNSGEGGRGAGRTADGGRSKSAGDGSIWRSGDAKDGSSGVTFTPPAAPAPETPEPPREYVLPSVDILERGAGTSAASVEKLKQTAQKLQQTLADFGVKVTVTDISCGPSVTRYELHPDQGVKVGRIVALQDDIKLNLAVADIRIEAPIPGKAAVGIEVPNDKSEKVFLADVLASPEFRKASSKISFAVGKGISGNVVVTDLAGMPHLLIAGATGSGKSVCINTIITSILFKAKPDEVKMIMIDPKMVELSMYNGIPHLLIPVVTDPKQASAALNWAVAEMTDRYRKFADEGVRDIRGYNKKMKAEESAERSPLPQIVVIVDEMADLMMVAASEVEDAICRLAQLARAAGIHLVVATQRPSVNVITGLIKANVQSRIAFAVSSGIDSRTILDMNGAEKLLGKGDMLFYPSGYPKPVRVQGAFISDEDVQKVVDFWKEQTDGRSGTNKAVQQIIASSAKDEGTVGAGERDELFEKAGRFIIEKEKASIGNLQRVFRIGFNRAARIMDQLSDYGVVGPDEGTKAREILMTMEEFEDLIANL